MPTYGIACIRMSTTHKDLQQPSRHKFLNKIRCRSRKNRNEFHSKTFSPRSHRERMHTRGRGEWETRRREIQRNTNLFPVTPSPSVCVKTTQCKAAIRETEKRRVNPTVLLWLARAFLPARHFDQLFQEWLKLPATECFATDR